MTSMLAKEITIAAIIPLFNGRTHIADALGSIAAQTRRPDEVIVVDDGSTDGGSAIVEEFAKVLPLRLLCKANGGQSAARNLGVAVSGSSHIAFLDQDDLWYPDHLAELEHAFRGSRRADLGWVYSNLDEVDADGLLVTSRMLDGLPATHPKRSVFECLGGDMFVLPSASLICRAAFEAVGGFDERLCGYEDDDLFLRMFRANFANEYLDLPLSKWRIHTASTSYSPLMARSRLIYAEKLFAAFPDDVARGRYFSRDLIAPRFLRTLLGQYLQAVRMRDRAGLKSALSSMHAAVVPHLPPVHRMLLRLSGGPMRLLLLARAICLCSPVVRYASRRRAHRLPC